jgi:hypothetical protein
MPWCGRGGAFINSPPTVPVQNWMIEMVITWVPIAAATIGAAASVLRLVLELGKRRNLGRRK